MVGCLTRERGLRLPDESLIFCEGYTTPYKESPLPGVLLAMMSTTTNKDTLQYESMGVRHDRT